MPQVVADPGKVVVNEGNFVEIEAQVKSCGSCPKSSNHDEKTFRDQLKLKLWELWKTFEALRFVFFLAVMLVRVRLVKQKPKWVC